MAATIEKEESERKETEWKRKRTRGDIRERAKEEKNERKEYESMKWEELEEREDRKEKTKLARRKWKGGIRSQKEEE